MKVWIIVLSLILLTGCWDRRELTEVGIVAAMAIDMDPETGEYILTSQYLRPAAESTQTPTPDRPYLMVSTTGKTISEVMRKANETIDRKSFFAHNKVIVISEEIAKEGLIPVIDAFQRGKEVRGYVWLTIAKGSSSKSIIETKANNISRIPADFVHALIENAEHNAAFTDVLNYYKKVLGAGIDPVAGVLTRIVNNEEKAPPELVKLSGGAVFKEDKLVGFLNQTETRGYNWVTAEGEFGNRGALILPSLLEEDKYVTILMQELHAEIKPQIDNGDQPTFTIQVDQKARVTGQEATGEFKSRKEVTDYLKKIEKEAEKEIEKEIKMVVDKAQQDLESDIFGFGRALNKKYPKEWDKYKENWSDKFVEVEYTLNVNVDLVGSGLIQGPFKPQE
ncbi:Ger(x)C family spore germination protein [Aquibacillus albus]|uniref:Spore germination protein KC n=1 Tax=Aquibacillus albus TaxID=1168171 RepID=A0ABS2MX33_9BACI|nr:Ger(x)C family spore germination protein [Aquibacillus albus]MBM7570463.1 spore germination protein KC [Aquibacillus albus]